jgi:hypothetical protein
MKKNTKSIAEIVSSIQAYAFEEWFNRKQDEWAKENISPGAYDKDYTDPLPQKEDSPPIEELCPKDTIIEGLKTPIGELLLKVGLEKYIIKFMDIGLTDKDKLSVVLDSHLKNMGITDPGERISILAEKDKLVKSGSEKPVNGKNLDTSSFEMLP